VLYPLSYEGEKPIVVRFVGTCKSIRKEAAEKPEVRGALPRLRQKLSFAEAVRTAISSLSAKTCAISRGDRFDLFF
jgi:hypothetical protein